MKTFNLKCPCCNESLVLQINGDDIRLKSDSVVVEKELKEILENLGIELG